MKRGLRNSLTLLVASLATLVLAQTKDSAFKAKWAKLASNPDKIFKVTARPGEEIPESTLNLAFGPGSVVSVSRGMGSRPKDMLDDSDIASVVNRNLRVVKFCYCDALKKDPEFQGDAIVGMKIKTTGKVAKVTIEPEEIAGHQFGKCLTPRVAKWQFPKFLGKPEDGLQVKSMGYEFPLSFARAE